MAGYADTRELIINTLMGRPAGTEIQPEDHQAFALQLTEYIRQVELVAGSGVPVAFAEPDTVPVQPDNGQAVYLSYVPRSVTKNFVNFINQSGNSISVTSSSGEVKLVTLLWNGSYWSSQIVTIDVLSDDSSVNASNIGASDYILFSTSSNYSIGDIVRYDGKLYKFTTEHAAGTWNGTDVELASINSILTSKLSELDKELGNLGNLNTNTKDTVVLAINEINEKVNSDVGLSPELKSILLQCFSKVAWSVEDGQSYLNSLRAALYPSKLLGIRAEYNGGVVKVGTSIYDLDISVYAIFNDVTEEIRDYTLSGEITSAENIITISYLGKTTDIVVNAAGIESITAMYNGGVVNIGTSLANLDISVYAVYSNGETEEVTDYALSGEITSETNIITITYSGFTTTIEVNAVGRILELPDMTYTSNGGTQVSITNGNHFKLIVGSDIKTQNGFLISLSQLSSNNPDITKNASLVNNQPSLFTIPANETITLKLLNVIEDVTYLASFGGVALNIRKANSSTSVLTAVGLGKENNAQTRPLQTQTTLSNSTDVGSLFIFMQLMDSGSIVEFDISMVNSDGKIYI